MTFMSISPLTSENYRDTISSLRSEHIDNLILCTHIREGFMRGIELNRIKQYADWYWENHLLKHFMDEEQIIFPILGVRHPLVKLALSDHRRLSRLFRKEEDIHKVLNWIEEELEAHVRFEEKVLFKEVERMEHIEVEDRMDHRDQRHATTFQWGDEFWKDMP